jgi:uncharacterized protein YfaS (alpha-2-macroglobulin family)
MLVTRLSDGKVVPGAALALYDATGAVRWQGTSDADGLAKVPGLAQLIPSDVGTDRRRRGSDGSPPFAMVSATLGGDTGVTLADWTGGFGPWGFGIEAAWEGKAPASVNLSHPGRGTPAGRHGDQGDARYRRLAVLSTKRTLALVTVSDSHGKEIFSRSLPLSDFGTFSAEVPVDPESPLGGYQIRASADVPSGKVETYGSFRVEEYRAPQFKVDVTTAEQNLFAGDTVKARVLARYLFGGAMPGAPVRWTAARTLDDYQPPNNAGFAFGVNTWEWNDENPMPSTDVVGAGEAKTDGQGAVELIVGQAETPGGRSATLTIEAEVTDVNRQRIANRTSVHLHPAALYAGIRQRDSGGFPEIHKPVTLEAIAVTPTGERQRAQVEVTVLRRDWKFVRKKTFGDRWETLSEPVEEKVAGCTVKVEATPGTCAFTPKLPGFYVLQAELTDGKKRKQTTRTSIYVVGEGWVSWQRNDSDRIDLVADKPIYDVGGDGEGLVKSPFPTAGVLTATRRRPVGTARGAQGRGDRPDVPVGAGHSDFYVGVVLVRGRVPRVMPRTGRGSGRPVRVGYVRPK